MYKGLIFFIAPFSALSIQSSTGNEDWLLALNFLFDMYTSDRTFNTTDFWYFGCACGRILDQPVLLLCLKQRFYGRAIMR